MFLATGTPCPGRESSCRERREMIGDRPGYGQTKRSTTGSVSSFGAAPCPGRSAIVGTAGRCPGLRAVCDVQIRTQVQAQGEQQLAAAFFPDSLQLPARLASAPLDKGSVQLEYPRFRFSGFRSATAGSLAGVRSSQQSARGRAEASASAAATGIRDALLGGVRHCGHRRRAWGPSRYGQNSPVASDSSVEIGHGDA